MSERELDELIVTKYTKNAGCLLHASDHPRSTAAKANPTTASRNSARTRLLGMALDDDRALAMRRAMRTDCGKVRADLRHR